MQAMTVRSSGVDLAVRSVGDPPAPTIVLVHGFPDTQAMWDLVVEHLRDDFHVVTYDVRGAGESTAPSSRAGYRMDRLVDDLVAVIEHVRPDGGAVHLVGHDWGSVQSWGSVLREESDPRLRGRLASYTTISGPALPHFGRFLRDAARHRRWRPLVKQLGHSWYIGAFQLPAVPELVFRRFGGRLRKYLSESQRLGRAAHWAPTFAEDGAHGVNLYRANSGGVASTGVRTRVPVQLIVPRFDAFLSPDLYDELPSFVDHLTRVDLPAGHWVPRTHPDVIADHIKAFVLAHE